MTEPQEIQQIIEQATAGNWIPTAVVGTAFSFVLALLVYIYNMTIKNNENRHSKTEEILTILTDNETELKIIVKEIQGEVKNIDGKVCRNIKDIEKLAS